MKDFKRIFVCTMVIFVPMVIWSQAFVSHIVERGETLESIAQKHGVTTKQLHEANPDINDFFYVGMKLNIPNTHNKDVPMTSTAETEIPNTHEKEIPAQTTYLENKTRYVPTTSVIDSKKNTWHFFFRLGPSIFKTQKSGSMVRDNSSSYSHSVGFEVTIGAHYYIYDNFFLSGGLGYYSNSSSATISSIGSSTTSEVSSHNIILPIEVGALIPISNKFGFVLEAGPSLAYAVGGKFKFGSEKYSFSEWEDKFDKSVDRFSAFIRLGGGIKWSELILTAYYGIPLTKTNGGEKNNFWGITLGYEL